MPVNRGMRPQAVGDGNDNLLAFAEAEDWPGNLSVDCHRGPGAASDVGGGVVDAEIEYAR